jgi:glycosyltransferase involved in cell wall biosynthesis
MPTLSVVIVACDEERTIARVLAAVQPLANEIILVDSGSTDRTIEIAKSFNVKLFHKDWIGYAAQKNYAISLATSDWILSLDADEVLTPELVSEIKSLLTSPEAKKYDGYTLPRILFIGNTQVKHGGFYPDAQLRLIQRGKGQFNDRAVHEAIKVQGPIKQLRNPMHHLAYENLAEFEATMKKYAALSAEEFAKNPNGCGSDATSCPFVQCANILDQLVHPPWTFFYRYVIRGGFLDGALGWQLNSIYADYVRTKIKSKL